MADNIGEKLNELSLAFDQLCAERHEAGQAEYGAFTFLGNDVIRMMAEELADTSNYCRMQFIKLMLLQEMLEEQVPFDKVESEDGKMKLGIGKDAFMGTKDIGWATPPTDTAGGL